MNGYLQRLVSTAQAPRAAIRPMLGSLFSASMREGVPQVSQEMGQILVNRQAAPLATREPQPAPAIHPPEPELSPTIPNLRRIPTHTQAVAAAEDWVRDSDARETFQPSPVPAIGAILPSESSPALETEPSFKPMFIEVPHVTGPKLQIDSESRPRENPIASAEPIVGRAQRAQPGEKTESHGKPRQVTRREPYSALVADESRRAEMLGDSRPRSSYGSRIGPTGSSPGGTPGQDADEIQIHIGRIEVTAVPPAPVRSPAQPVRRSLKLGEYLRRGRGSAL